MLKRSLNLYITSVVVGAGLIVGALLLWQHIIEPWWLIVVWALSGWISDMYPVNVRSVNGNSMLLGLSMTFNLTAAVLFSPPTAAIVGFLAGAPTFEKTKWYKALFNASQISISTAFTSLVYHVLSQFAGIEILKILIIGVAIIIYAISNNIFVSIALGISSGKKIMSISKDILIDFFGASIFIALGIAYLMIYLYPFVDLWVIPIALGPLLMIRFILDLYRKILNSKVESMYALLKALEEKDTYTAGHGDRVAIYTEIVGERLGFSGKHLEDLKMAARLHDLGKIGIKDRILNKPGKLDMNEFGEIKKHPIKGAEIISEVPSFKNMIPWIKHHHERWDGKGYPDGLSGNDIPMEARIIGISDIYDALTTKRAYRDAFSGEEALQLIKDESGNSFDPVVAAAFLDVIDKIDAVRLGKTLEVED